MATNDYKLKVVTGVYPVTLDIDGQAIEAFVTRFTVSQFGAFMSGFRQVTNPPSVRAVLVRHHGDEQAQDPSNPDGRFIIPDDEIQRRRLDEMSPEQRAAHARQVAAEEAFAEGFVTQTLSEHLRIKPGQIEVEDPTTGACSDLTTGEEFARAFGARVDVLQAALYAMVRENTLPASAKNVSRSPSGSGSTSTNGERTAEIPAPGIATGVEPGPSATTADVTASSVTEPSGRTAAASA